MSLGTKVGLGPGDFVLEGTQPLPLGHSPDFRSMSIVAKRLDGMEVGLGPSDIVLDGDPAPPPQKGDRAV